MRPSAKQIACIRMMLADGSEPTASEQFRAWFEISETIWAECPTSRHLATLANDTSRSLAERSLALWTLGELNARSSARAVLKVLLGSEPNLSWHAAGTLSIFKVRGLVRPLVEAIRTSGHSHIKEGAIWVLTKYIDKRALSVLIEATSDQSYYIRRAAVHALIGYPCRRTFLALSKALQDPLPAVWATAVFAISCLSNQEESELVVPALTKFLADNRLSEDRSRPFESHKEIEAILARIRHRARGTKPKLKYAPTKTSLSAGGKVVSDGTGSTSEDPT